MKNALLVFLLATAALPAAPHLCSAKGYGAILPKIQFPWSGNKPSMSAPVAQEAALRNVDLSRQFPAQANDQGNIGACHVFAGVGLVEAAYYRQYGRHVDLAEQDLFARSTLGGAAVCNSARVYGVGKSTAVSFGEGAFVANDAINAVMGGITPDDRRYCASYDEFSVEYLKFRNKLEKALKLRGKPLPFVMPGKLDKVIERTLRPTQDAQRARKEMSAALKGFKVIKDDLFYEMEEIDYRSVSPDKCRALGAKARSVLLSHLNAGRPVAVGMILDGLEQYWGHTRMDEPSAHAFIVSGYSVKGSKLVFKTRNSWALFGLPVNPPLKEEHLCHVTSVTAVLIPGEK